MDSQPKAVDVPSEHYPDGYRIEDAFFLDPDWKCPRCSWMNKAIRDGCRHCGYVGGECPTHEVTPEY